MTRPRQILPGTTYLITRRTTQRQFWLRPAILINQILLYCLAVAARRYQVKVHVVAFMSNHWHVIVTDPHGNIPLFLAWFHKFTANCVNELYGREENLWSDKGPDYKVLETEEDILAATIYCMANPVKAGLVATAESWPGICSLPEDVAGAVCVDVERPPVYFSSDGTMPERETLILARLPIFSNLSDEALTILVHEKLSARESEIAQLMEDENRTFLGAQAVLDTEPSRGPDTPSEKTAHDPLWDVKRLKPSAIAAAKRRRQFLQAYADARKLFLAGNRDAVFPAGTYALARRYGVAVEPYAPG